MGTRKKRHSNGGGYRCDSDGKLVAFDGCDKPKQGGTAPNPGTQASTAQAARITSSGGTETDEELSGDSLSRFNDAKIYCLGMMLYAAKNQNVFPTNLEQTLPYLREASLTPSGTYRFARLLEENRVIPFLGWFEHPSIGQWRQRSTASIIALMVSSALPSRRLFTKMSVFFFSAAAFPSLISWAPALRASSFTSFVLS